jgi:hypothetical protein
MRATRRRPAAIAGVGALSLIVVVAACTLLSGAGGANTAGATPGQSSAASDSTFGDIGLASGLPLGSGTATSAEPSASAMATAPVAATATPRPPTPRPTAKPAPCGILPASNVWNKPITKLSVASNSAAMIDAIGLDSVLHPDFDAIGDGIPYNVVTSSTATYKVKFQYAGESDAGPYPIPSSPKIEKGSDRHLLSIDLSQCKLWELYDARKSGSSWTAGSGAVFNLRSNNLRPAGWTSADAAGLPIYPGLVRYAEVAAGSINHALRFTAPDTCGYIYPARHLTAATCSNLPPMGLRVRLKASVDISGFGPHARVVLTALKRYGMILADNGSPWYVSGAPDSRWNDDEMHKLQTLTGADFEVVNTSSLRNG